MDDRKQEPPRRRKLMLGGQVLYDPAQTLSDTELGRRIALALRNVGWRRGGRPEPAPRPPASRPRPLLPPGRLVSG